MVSRVSTSRLIGETKPRASRDLVVADGLGEAGRLGGIRDRTPTVDHVSTDGGHRKEGSPSAPVRRWIPLVLGRMLKRAVRDSLLSDVMVPCRTYSTLGGG